MATSYRTFKNSRRSRASWLSKLAPVLVTGFGFVASALFVPSNSSQKTEARIFTQGLSIQIDRSSPAYAALEDTLSEDTQSVADFADMVGVKTYQAAPVKVLTPSVGSEPVALRIVRETRREEALMNQERLQRIQNSQALVAALVNVAQSLPVAPPTAPIERSVRNISAAELAQFFAPLIKSPRPEHLASGTHVFPSSPQAQASNRTVALNQPKSASEPQRAQASGMALGMAMMSGAAQSQICLNNQNQNVHQLVISGPLQFAGGIAITSASDRVVVFREDEEEKMEPAAVWLKDAKYEVFVDQPVGRLVGELRASSGEVLGRGYVDLACLPKIEARNYRVDRIPMTIAPVPHGIMGRVLTAAVASQANPKAKVRPVPNAHIQLGQLPFSTLSKRDGQFSEESLIEGSLIVAHVDRPGHWSSMAFTHVGSSIDLAMFSDQTMRSIIFAATGSDHANENTSFVWGKVTRGGVAVAGAKVDLMTSTKEIKPIYFNAMMLPDPTLKETSENGLYAFFPLEPGSHAVQATDGHSVTEPVLFPTDEQTVTQANLELAVTKQAKLRVFDAFKTDWPLAAEVTSTGRKRGVVVTSTGEKNVTFTGGDALLILDADAGSSYDRVRVVVPKSEHKIDFPMIQSVWLDRIRGAVRFNPLPSAGTVVGLIRGADTYRVSLEEGSITPTTKIVYFDAKGEVINTPYGIRGGGFVILNMPPGFRTVLMQPSGSSKALATTVLVENRVTNVISKAF